MKTGEEIILKARAQLKAMAGKECRIGYQTANSLFDELGLSAEDQSLILTEFEQDGFQISFEEDTDDGGVFCDDDKDGEELLRSKTPINSTGLFFSDILQYEILSREEEAALGVRIVEGNRAKQVLSETSCDVQDVEKLKQAVLDGKAAENKLVESNLRLTAMFAREFLCQKNYSVEYLDLIQYGNIGLMEAAKRFDPSKGYRFGTYACWWIRRYILRGLAEGDKMIRLPIHVMTSIYKINSAKSALTVSLCREPTTAEIADKTGIPADKVQKYLDNANDPVSIDNTVGTEEKHTLGELIQDHNAVNPETKAVQDDLRSRLYREIEALPEKERVVMVCKFGLEGGDVMSLSQIGKVLGCSREYVRQLESKALKKLHSKMTKRKLVS